MTLLIIGLVVFIGIHFFPRFRAARRSVIDAIGEGPYKGLFSVVSLVSIVVVVYAYRRTDFIEVYEAPSFGRDVTHALMPFAFLLAAGANMKSNLKRYVRHPLSWAVVVWAVAHLTANGDLASVILFGGLGLFAAVNMTVSSMAGPASAPPNYPRKNDIILVVAGLVSFLAVMWAHGAIFGVYVVG